MAEAQLFISVACILAVFDISRGVDEMDRLVEPRAEFTSGLIRYVREGSIVDGSKIHCDRAGTR